jgi:hypothetical protein
MGDIIKIEILEDGVISITTDKISSANHMSADELLNEITKLAGGERHTHDRTDVHHDHVHVHDHNHIHTH